VCVNTKPETGFFICFVEFNFQSLKLYMRIFLVRRGNTLNMMSSQHIFFSRKKCCGLKRAAMKAVGIHKIRVLCIVHCYTKMNDLENVT
jgi:hypothetical protein